MEIDASRCLVICSRCERYILECKTRDCSATRFVSSFEETSSLCTSCIAIIGYLQVFDFDIISCNMNESLIACDCASQQKLCIVCNTKNVYIGGCNF